jgi:drug/metabolite transporter (DMT)-like permease
MRIVEKRYSPLDKVSCSLRAPCHVACRSWSGHRHFLRHRETHKVALLIVTAVNKDDGRSTIEDRERPLSDSTTNCDENGGAMFSQRFLTGNGYLLAVSFLWGSYNPTLRAIFTTPGGPSPLVVAACRGCLQALLLLLVTWVVGALTPSDQVEPQNIDGRPDISRPFLPIAIRGGLEIGTWNTLGTLCQTWGISTSTATRSAFLVQATALWTPLLAAALGLAPNRWLWCSSFIAFASTIVVTLDQIQLGAEQTHGAGMGALLAGGVSMGDATTLAAAFFYSLSTVRIPFYAQKMTPLKLACGKSVVLATLAMASLSVQVYSLGGASGSAAEVLQELWPNATTQQAVWSLLVWSAVGPGALSAFLHVKGQSMVGPTDAQVLFATVPLWSALLAAAFLPGETVGPLTWVGGAGMLLAGGVAAFGGSRGRETAISLARDETE